MRKYNILLIVALLFVTSCKDNDPLPLTPDFVIEVKAYDLDNNGNGSDIRLDFEVENNLNVSEYRVMILQSKDSVFLDLSIAQSIPRDNYLIIIPVPFETKYSISRMPADLSDVNGVQITNGFEYVVVILVEGLDDFQLSGFSRPFTLLDRGIYSGVYELTLAVENYTVDLAIIEGVEGNYSGRMFGEDAVKDLGCDPPMEPFFDLGLIFFKVSENTISDFLWQRKLSIPCEVIFVEQMGDGVIANETTLLIKPFQPTPLTEFFMRRK